MSDHYFIAADHGHLRIFLQRQHPGQHDPDLDLVQSLDFPAGRQSYVARETSMAGRFQGSGNPATAAGSSAARTGMSIDERLPMQREEQRRRARDIAQEIETFFAAHRDATWDFAGTSELHNAVVDQLSDRVRVRLRRSLAKDLVNQRPEDVRAAFTVGLRS